MAGSRSFLNTIIAILSIALIGWFVVGYFFGVAYVSYAAMSPMLPQGSIALIDKNAYRNASPRRGDVIAFAAGKTLYLRRVVGLPGDNVQMKGGELFINDTRVVRERLEDAQSDGAAVRQYKEILPEGATYVVWETTATGMLDCTLPETVPADHYFVLGDNRDVATDSRTPSVGSIGKSQLIGKASPLLNN